MINYSYLYAPPRSQVVYLCRPSVFQQPFFSCALWLGRNLVKLFCISRKSFRPALFYIHTLKKPTEIRISGILKLSVSKEPIWNILEGEKNQWELYFYTTLQILHTPEPAGSARQYCQCCHVRYVDPNVGETLFLVPHICGLKSLVLLFQSAGVPQHLEVGATGLWSCRKVQALGVMLQKSHSSLILKGCKAEVTPLWPADFLQSVWNRHPVQQLHVSESGDTQPWHFRS